MRSVLLAALFAGAEALAGAARAPALARGGAPAMAAVPVAKFDGAAAGEEAVELRVAKAGAYLVHRKVVAEQANMRLGTAKAKTRMEVRGGGRKPYQQKGTGRARRGSSRSPLLVGGGVSFGPRGGGKARYALKMNKKEKRLAISTALMSAVGKMTVVEDLDTHFAAPKTKDMKAFLERVDVDTDGRQSTLILTKDRHENTYLSARNIPYLTLSTLDNINARDILKAKKVLVASSALAEIKDRYSA